MKTFFAKWGHLVAAFALVCASMSANMFCGHCYYQSKVPEAARKMHKF